MTKAVSIEDIKAEQDVLNTVCQKAQQAMYDAKSDYAEKKNVLIKFNNKYGRVLQMMNED